MRRADPPKRDALLILLRRAVTALAFASVFGTAATASGFCRTTTCNPKVEYCGGPNPGDCKTVGVPLKWGSQCIAFAVHASGSVRQGITSEQATAVAQDAFRTWLTADCGSGTPSLNVWDLSVADGPVTCGHPEFNACAPNANVMLFREDAWPYEGDANVLAYTNVTFVPSTGEILDADIEINAVTTELTVTGEVGQSDLSSLVTHEVGHFLGLDHSDQPDATMWFRLEGTTEMRSLAPDDVLGICTIYPPGVTDGQCSSPRLVHGFTRSCVQTSEEASDDEGVRTVSCAAERPSGCSCRIPTSRGDRRSDLASCATAIAIGCVGIRRRGRRIRPVAGRAS